jgi:hypothetical protein
MKNLREDIHEILVYTILKEMWEESNTKIVFFKIVEVEYHIKDKVSDQLYHNIALNLSDEIDKRYNL